MKNPNLIKELFIYKQEKPLIKFIGITIFCCCCLAKKNIFLYTNENYKIWHILENILLSESD